MPYRLVSLRDLIMHLINAGHLVRATSWVSNINTMTANLPSPASVHFSLADLAQLKGHLKAIQECGDELGLRGISVDVKAVLAVLDRATTDNEGATYSALDTEWLQSTLGNLCNRIPTDLEERNALIVPGHKVDLYDQSTPLFGGDVDLKFKRRGRHEIAEAGKCLALERPTACVFHLMRLVEIGLESIRTSLGLPRPTKGQHKAWGAALDVIKTEIEAREKLTHLRQWTDLADKKFFDGAHMMLVAIKNGCRDDTMHIESTYTDDEATHLFALTKGFMQKVASRLDENGLPLA
ncbi:hypothetical protein [Hyphomicrobium sp.]|uniref:hypothetical protein n=1 Tax=Hyphomicrobium sp. TaxID=82 RepID=UPI003F6FF20D